MTDLNTSDDQESMQELSDWFSTYGLITADRILNRYKIQLSPDALKQAIKHADNPYHALLKIPLANVMNGIILQQVKDYQIYLQKLFIDYLLSGEAGKPETSPGANTRKELESLRLQFIKCSEDLEALEYSHLEMISESQRKIKPLAQSTEHNSARNPVLEELMDRIRPITGQIKQFRETLYDLILKSTELMKNLPEYRLDVEKINSHKEGLLFDRSIGDEGINPKDLV